MKRWITVLCLSVTLGCAPSTVLTVKLGKTLSYTDEKGDCLSAQYGRLSDGSLNFVKVKMPDGRAYTLPQAVSASGTRYTDDREIVWWENHGVVRVDVRGVNGEWAVKYPALHQK